MKKNKTIRWLILLAVVLGLAWFGYNALVGDYAPNQLQTPETDNQTSNNTTADKENTDTDAAESSAGTDEQPQVAAVDCTVYDADGNAVKLSDYFGKPLVLNFWASWCGPCQSEMPDFQSVYAEYGEEVNFMMINLTDGSRETTETALTFINKNNYTFPVFFDTTLEATSAYGASTIPTTFIIDAEGYIVGYAKGPLDAETLTDTLSKLL